MMEAKSRKLMMMCTDHNNQSAVCNGPFGRLSDGAFSCSTSPLVALALVFDIVIMRIGSIRQVVLQKLTYHYIMIS